MPLDTEVDSAVANGLLTASSIIFGFMLVLIHGRKNGLEDGCGWLWSFFVISFLMLIFAGTELFIWGLDRAYPIDALSFVMASFQANVVGAAILFALRETIRKISQSEKNFSIETMETCEQGLKRNRGDDLFPLIKGVGFVARKKN